MPPGERHVDGTFGAGGYSLALAARGARVFAIDQDPDAIAEGQGVVAASDGAITLVPGNFSEMDALLRAAGIESVDGVTLDIGVSLDAARPRAARLRLPLSRRAARHAHEPVGRDGGGMAQPRRRSRDCRRALPLWRGAPVAPRRPLHRRGAPARHHRRSGRSLPQGARQAGPGDKTDPATRTFQAIRIFINAELDALERGLEAAEAVLKAGGRLAIVTFHSLEDRIVKNSCACAPARSPAVRAIAPEAAPPHAPSFAKPARAVRPGDEELRINPRARSATLRRCRAHVRPILEPEEPGSIVMIAIKRLQSIMWILIIAAGALSAYLISLRVATERNAVTAIERQIYATRANIRYLEVEFSARSNMRQLAAWNAQDIKYSVPGPGQYLNSERQLASLDSIEPSGSPYVAPPVMAAMAQGEGTPEPAPAMIVPVKAEAPVKDPGFAPVRTVSADAAARPRATSAVALARSETTPRIVQLVDKPVPEKRRAMRLAQLEATLLDMRTPGQTSKAAR